MTSINYHDVTGSYEGAAISTLMTHGAGKSSIGMRVAILGDSITYQGNDYAGGTDYKSETSGYMSWLQFYSRNACDFVFREDGTGYNFGVGSDTTTLVLARINAVLSAKPAMCIVLIGTNDCNSSTAFSTITGNLHTIYQTLGKAGIQVVAIPILPRANSSWASSARRRKSLRVNDYIRRYNIDVAYYGNGGKHVPIVVSDPTSLLIDQTNANGDPLTGLTRDGLHPSPKGAERIGFKLWSDLQRFLAPSSVSLMYNQEMVYDATDNPRGNLLTNGMMTGTAGTVSSGGSGSGADSWTFERGSGTGISFVCSKGSTSLEGDAGVYQTVVASVAGTGATTDSMYVRQNITTNFAAGDRVTASVLIRVRDITANGLVCVRLHIRQEGSTTFAFKGMDQYDSTMPHPIVDHTGVISLTAPMTLLAGVTTIRARLEILMDGTQTGSATIDIGNFMLQKVEA